VAEKVKEPGMDEAQAQMDRQGFRTSVEMITGGVRKMVGEGTGPEVGNQYDVDPLGEERDDNLVYGSGTNPTK
jgi:hypothetical protein